MRILYKLILIPPLAAAAQPARLVANLQPTPAAAEPTEFVANLQRTPAPASAQLAANLQQQILDRLARLEEENRALRRELDEIRQTVAGRPPAAPTQATATERLDVHERRIDEQAQTKVEASQRFPIRLTGMALANLFHNGPNANGLDVPTQAARANGRSTAGLSFRQSVFGMEYGSTASVWGGQVRGSLFFDFFDGLAEATFGPARLRTATLELDWKSRSVLVGLEKPLFSQRDPMSFSYSGISPLTGSGNLWRWHPQIRFEQRLPVSAATQLRAQIALVQTNEDVGLTTGLPVAQLERRRPGAQGRLEFRHRLDETRRIEIAPAFHTSQTHFNGAGISSSLFAMDWFANPWSRLEFSGMFFAGQNVHHFGALRQSFTIRPGAPPLPVHSRGGWSQFTVPVTTKLSFNLFGGIHDDRNRDLPATGIGANRTGAGNVMYRLAPNVILSLEALQLRTSYLGSPTRINNRYDLAVAYLF